MSDFKNTKKFWQFYKSSIRLKSDVQGSECPNIIKDNDEKKEHSIKTLEIEKRDLQEKLDLYKMKGEETNEELMVKKIEFSRDNALMKQQVKDYHDLDRVP